MATIRKIPVEWVGFPGAPGWSVFYSPEATDAVASIKAFFTAQTAHWPSGMSVNVPFAGDSFEDATGELSGSWTSANGGTVTSTSSGAYAAGTGAYVRWLTGGIVAGRRVKGRTFLTPLLASVYETNGTITATALGPLQAAASVLGAANTLVIWSRPFVATKPGEVSRSGSSHNVIAGIVPDRATSLRTRRS